MLQIFFLIYFVQITRTSIGKQMAQSEAGKSVRTVPNDEAEEEFGPQLITKLEVCTMHFFKPMYFTTISRHRLV